MMNALRLFALGLALWAAPVNAQVTQPQVNALIAANLPSCGDFCISATALRAVLQEMNQATFQFTQFPNTFTALQTFNGGIAGSGPIGMINTTTPASFTTPGYSFNDVGIVGFNFSDAQTHIAFAITGNSPATGTGSYTGTQITQFGTGRDSSAFVTGAVLEAIATGGNGNYTGGNQFIVICGTAVIAGTCPFGTAAAVNSAVGSEINIFSSAGATIFYKEGLRIADLGVIQATGANHLSGGIVMVRDGTNGSPGFEAGIYFGDPNVGDNDFPITTTGTLIKALTVSRAVDSIIDGTSLAGGITTAAIRLPESTTAIKWPSWGLLESSSFVAFQTGSTNAALFQASASLFSGTVQSGNPGTNAGGFLIEGLTSGVVSILPGNANAGTFNFNLPVTAGSSGNVLASGGGGSNPMTWTSPTVTINTVACTLGSSCTISAAASLVVASTTITGSCTNGFNLFNNAGVLGCQANAAGGGLTVGSTTITSGTTQQILYDNAGVVGEITKGNNCVYGTNGTGVPSCVTTLPSAVTASSLTSVSTLTGGATGAGFTVALATSTITGQLALANGGTAANLTASNGGVVYSTASALAILAGTVTAGQCLLSGSTAAPTWGSCTGSSGITVGSTTITSGTTQQLLYDNAGVVGEVTKGNNCVYGTNGTGVPSCVTTLPSAVVASSLTSVGTLTGLTSSGTINVTTVGGTMVNASSANTGSSNIFQIANSGASTNGNTKALFQMALTDAGCGVICDFQMFVAGNASTPFAAIATDLGLTGGFFIATGAGPIQFNGKTNLQFQVNAGAAFDCAFTTASVCTFTYATVTPKVTANVHISNGSAPAGNTGTCNSGVTVAGGSTAGNWSSTSACNIAGTIILSGLPTAPTGYACDAWDITTANVVLQPTGSTVNSHTFTVRTTNASANDNIRFKCLAY